MICRRFPTALALVLLAVALGCANPADNAPEAQVSDPAPAAQAEAAPATEPAPKAGATADSYFFGEGSTLSFVGSKVTGSHDGGFERFQGQIQAPGGDFTKGMISVAIDTRSVWSDKEKLTSHLKDDDFLDVENHPSATFKSTAIEAEGEGYAITGELQIRSTTKTIRFPASLSMDEGGVRAQAEFFIKRFDFGIAYPGKADNLIRDEVVIKFDLKASAG
ncbi:MAG: YceI family protein [Myxococcota bacterium]|nr:YceI family protein [Myxococcota bacterium]